VSGPPAPDVAFLLMALGRRVRDEVDARLDAHGLTYRHLSALGHLRREPDLSYSELARRAGVTVQSIQATVRGLIDLGAIEQVGAGGQGRRAQLQVTAHGRRLLTSGTDVVRDVGAGLTADLEPDQAAALTAALAAVFVREVSG
jgi:DNA-binding MarR family transcriptional regulator